MSETNHETRDQKEMDVSEKGPIANIESGGDVGPAIDGTGFAVVEQGRVIPTTGERKITTRWEYWSYCLYGTSTWTTPV